MDGTINHIFRESTQQYGDSIAVEKNRGGNREGATWNQLYERSRAVGLGLRALGIRKGDRVCILSTNRLEWLYADMGILGIGGIVVPSYHSLLDEEVRHYVSNADSKVIIVEDKSQLEKALYVSERYPELERIIVIDAAECECTGIVMTFQELMAAGNEKHAEDPHLFERLADEITPDDTATCIYTPGTSGFPKGALISHGNIVAALKMLENVSPPLCTETDRIVNFLPLSHIYERMVHFYGLSCGFTRHYVENLNTIFSDIQQKKPTVLFVVPQFLEILYRGILFRVKRQSSLQQRLFHWSQKIGSRMLRNRETHTGITRMLQLQYKIAYRMIFRKLQDALGGCLRCIYVAGAPTANEILDFFHSAGISILEGYIMTEACGYITTNTIDDFKNGSVGRPLAGIDLRIAEDGEILIASDTVFKGYLKMEHETREVFTSDGYLQTGDIGVMSADGHLIITDRKKDMIITSGGKKIAPQKIENHFKVNPLFDQFVVVGDRRKYITALINLDMELATQFASDLNIQFQKPEDLICNQDFLDIIDDIISEKNEKLAQFERIKKYRIVEIEFSKDTGELSASSSVKRRSIQEKYIDVIESMYKE
jgi:long-chain acyl-CoA synthetase